LPARPFRSGTAIVAGSRKLKANAMSSIGMQYHSGGKLRWMSMPQEESLKISSTISLITAVEV
jgi:hypothetical protein